MIFCNGCSKTGTHILTNICRSLNKKQIGGTLVKRKPESPIILKGTANIEKVFSFGNTLYVHSHIAYADQLEFSFTKHKHLMTIRHPRNLAVSWMRHRLKQDSNLVASHELLASLISGGMFGESIPQFYSNFFGWLNVSNIHVIKFEEFVSRQHDLSSTEHYLKAKPGSLSYDTILGNSSTFTGSYSLWEDWWDSTVDSAWKKAGGDQVDSFIDDYMRK